MSKGRSVLFAVLVLLFCGGPASGSCSDYLKDVGGRIFRYFTSQVTPTESGVPPEWFHDDNPTARMRVYLPDWKPIEAVTVPELFLAQARQEPDRVKLIDDARGPMTNRDIVAGVYFLKPHIEALGAEPNVGVMLPASAMAPVVSLATMFAGKTPAMLNFSTGKKNLTSMIETGGIKKIITSKAMMEKMFERFPELKEFESMFVYLEDLGQAPGAKKAKAAAFAKSRYTRWTDLDDAIIAENSFLLFTSGSTSTPKAVPVTHTMQIANVKDILDTIPLYRGDKIAGIATTFHSVGATGNIVLPLISEAKVGYYANPLSGKGIAEQVGNFGLTAILGTPSQVQLTARSGTEAQLKTLRVGVVGAEPLTEKAAKGITENMPKGFVLHDGYGLTETGPTLAVDGILLPHVTGLVVDENEKGDLVEVPVGGLGRLLVRGKNVFKGYHNYNGESGFVVVNGVRWYDTGDMVLKDANPRKITVKGRAAMDFTKIGGEKVSHKEITSALDEKLGSGKGKVEFAVAADERGDKKRLVLFTTLDLDVNAINKAITDAGFTNLYYQHRVVTLKEFPTLPGGKLNIKQIKSWAQEDKPNTEVSAP